jgi:hypothetical protein
MSSMSSGMTNLELTDRELSQIIQNDRYPLSPRIRVLEEALGILRPEPARPAPLAPETALRAAEPRGRYSRRR